MGRRILKSVAATKFLPWAFLLLAVSGCEVEQEELARETGGELQGVVNDSLNFEGTTVSGLYTTTDGFSLTRITAVTSGGAVKLELQLPTLPDQPGSFQWPENKQLVVRFDSVASPRVYQLNDSLPFTIALSSSSLDSATGTFSGQLSSGDTAFINLQGGNFKGVLLRAEGE